MNKVVPPAAVDLAAIAAVADTKRGWDRGLTQRLRVLLHTTPLHDLHRADNLRDADLRHYDSLALALKVFDVIIEHTGFDHEVDREALVRTLSPLLTAMDVSAGIASEPERHAQMLDRVLTALRNDGDRRLPFRLTYSDVDEQGTAVKRAGEFRLLADQFHPGGGVVLRLSNEAVNLYLNALELDIEDAQAAAEAVVQSQLARGRFNEAVQSAKNARWQSLRYQQKVANVLRETQRDIGRVDWREEVPRLLDEAVTHITVRLATEENILTTAEERLDVLPGSDERTLAVVEVIRLVRDCRLRHVDLHDQLMRARNVFLDEQARQTFTPTPRHPLPELLSGVLEPLLALRRSEAAAITTATFPAFVGAQPRPVLSITQLIAWQLQPRRELRRMEVSIDPQDLTQYGSEIAHYPLELRNAAEEILAKTESPYRLSSLLQKMKAEGAPQALLELLTLLALQYYAPEEDNVTYRCDRAPAEGLNVAGFFGDDLEIHRMEFDHGTAK